jgi:FMN phosphatase YigB (HAD superfamily)
MADPPSAVTMDLWHTLLYLKPEAEEAYMDAQMDLAADVLDEAPPQPGAAVRSRDDLRGIFEEVYAEAVASAQEGISVTPAVQLARAAERGGRNARPDAYVDGLRRLVAGTPFRIAPAALRTVTLLRERGWRTAVISNTIGEPGETLRPILKSMGFDSLIEEYLFSDELPWTKPDPAIFLEALRRLGVAAANAVHVGDGWSDMEGARRAGMRARILYTGLQSYGARYQALFLPAGWASPPADYRIDTLAALPTLADRLLAPAPP